MSRATRELILAGTEPRPFAVPALGGAEVLLRALRVPEALEVRAIQIDGITMSGAAVARALAGDAEQIVGAAQRRVETGEEAAGLSVDLAALVTADGRAWLTAAAYGLVEPALSRAEIEASGNADAIEQIGREVMRRSGLGKKEARGVAAFRSDGRGPDDPGPAPDGHAPGDDPAGPHLEPA